MSIAILIDADTERLARRLAEAEGKPLAEVVRAAIAASARDAVLDVTSRVQLTAAEKLARLRAISDRSAARPLLDPRPPDEIIGYDGQGLPV